MFGRSESNRERTLLRVVDQLIQENHELMRTVIHLAGHQPVPPELPELEPFELEESEPLASALDGVPPMYASFGEEE